MFHLYITLGYTLEASCFLKTICRNSKNTSDDKLDNFTFRKLSTLLNLVIRP